MQTVQEQPCFICDGGTSDSGIPLHIGQTTHSKTGLPIKLGQMVGDDFMVIVSVDDRLCMACITLIDHADKLEIELGVVRKVIMQQLKTKYNLADSVEGPNGENNVNKLGEEDDEDLILNGEKTEIDGKSEEKSREGNVLRCKIITDMESIVSNSDGKRELSTLLKPPPLLPLPPIKSNKIIRSIKTLKSDKTDKALLHECTMCGERFSSQVQLRRHIMKTHLSTWSCYFCNVTFEDNSAYIEHMETHLDRCGKNSTVAKDVVQPSLKSDPNEIYCCKYCKFKTKRKSIFDKHRCPSLRCPTCRQYFKSKEELDSHEGRTHERETAVNKYQCGICSSLHCDKESLVVHLRTHKTILDRILPEETVKDTAEIIEVNVDVNTSEESHRQEKPSVFQCSDCLSIFEKESAYLEHDCVRKNKEDFEKSNSSEPEVYFENVEHFMALSDHRTKDNSSSLNINYISSEVFSNDDEEEGEKTGTMLSSYICTVCSAPFDDKLNLEKHEILTGHKVVDIISNDGFKYRIIKPDDLAFKIDIPGGKLASDIVNSVTKVVGGDGSMFNALEQFGSGMKVESVQEEEGGNYTLTCDDCSFVASSFEELKKHKVCIHAMMMDCEAYFSCNICSAYVLKSDEKEHLNTHKVNIVGTTPILSSIKKASRSSSGKKKLSDKETDYKRGVNQEYLCQFCSEKFKTKKALKSHEEMHPEGFEFQCIECDKKFMKEKQLKAHHDETHRDANCRYCGKQILNLKALKNHEQRHNKASSNPRLECYMCKRVFMTQTGLRHHFAVHTGKFKYFCDFCQRGFMSRMMLEEHRSCHTKEERYVCDVCGRKFTFQSTYWIHRKWHDNPFPYKCNFCGRLFRHTSLLAVHKRKHTGERPYKCPHCPMNFAVGGTLKRHMILHTQKFPYNCETCKRGFTTRHKYSVHLAKAHNNFELLNKKLSEQEDYKMVVREVVGDSSSVVKEDRNDHQPPQELEEDDEEEEENNSEEQPPSDSFEFIPDSSFALVNLEEDDGSGIMATPCIMATVNNEDNAGRVFEIVLGSPLQQISSIPLSESPAILPDMWCQ